MTAASQTATTPTDELKRRRCPGRRRTRLVRRTAPVAAGLLGLGLIAAGCGGGSNRAPSPGSSAGSALAQLAAYSRCMRAHGIADYPDPTPNPGGPGGSISINGGPGSDLDRNNPRFIAANHACQSLEPGGASGTPQQSAEKIAAEVKWARCMRTHGVPSFPDPNAQGAFHRSSFNESALLFQSASKACESLQRSIGPVPVY